MSKDAIVQFEKGDGGELHDQKSRFAKMKALHSSSALGVNLFHYWNTKNEVNKIAHSCGLCSAVNTSSKKVVFEKKFKISKKCGLSRGLGWRFPGCG